MGLRVRGLSFRYPRAESPVFEDVSFDAVRGEITTIIGPNGMGKTTMLKSIAGLIRADGEVTAEGRIAYMTQDDPLPTSLTAEHVILLGRVGELSFRVPPSETERVRAVIEMLRIEHIAGRPFRELSGGMRRIVCIAQTIVREPAIMLMDEPTANLDMQNELETIDLIRHLTTERRIATVLVLHDLNSAARCSDKLVLLKGGRVLSQGTPAEVLTEEAIEDAYGVQAKVWVDPHGIPTIHPIRSVRSPL